MSRISQAVILSILSELHASAAAPSILREHEVRAPSTEQNTPAATSSSPQTRAQSGPAPLLGNIGVVPQNPLDTLGAVNFALPTIEFDPEDYAETGLSADELASIGIGKPRKKTFLEHVMLKLEHERMDAKGWELLQKGADAETAHNVLTAVQVLMEDRKIEYFGGLAGCRVRALPQLEKNADGKNEKVMGFDGKSVLAPSATHRYCCNGEVSYSMKGLQLCSSPLKCPVCGRKITYFRRLQIEWGVSLLLEDNKNYLMMTLTAPHSENTDPVLFVNAFCDARRNFMKSASWKKTMKKFNYYNIISGNEITVDAPWSKNKSGMHFHSHCLLFFDRGEFNQNEIEELRTELSIAWTEECEKVKLVTPSRRAAHREYGLDISQKERTYTNNMASSKAADYIAKEVSFEVAAAPGSKVARRPDRLNQWQLMLLATSTHPELIPDLDRVLIALNKRHLTDWTKKIQTQYGIPTVKQIKAIFQGGNPEEILSENIKISQQICKKHQTVTAPATLAATESELVTESAAIEEECTENMDESEENKEIMQGKSGEEVLQISFVDAVYINYYGAQYKFIKSIPTRHENGELFSLQDAAECAKIAIQLISKGIDPLTFEKLIPKRTNFLKLMYRAQDNEHRRAKAGYENPVSWSEQPLLFDMEDVI